MTSIHIPVSRQGQTGMGQGGWTSHQFVQAIGEPVTVALKSPIPLETDLDVIADNDRWRLIDPACPDVTILEATRWIPDYASTTAVSVAAADAARRAFPLGPEDHPAPHCLSCGLGEHSLQVHAGPLGDGRWATPFRSPPWSLVDGAVDLSLLWMAMDCACGWYTSHSGETQRRGVTVQFAVDVHTEVRPETDYVLVAWNGSYGPDWDGRKRGAEATLFDTDGACVAQSKSFWIATQ